MLQTSGVKTEENQQSRSTDFLVYKSDVRSTFSGKPTHFRLDLNQGSLEVFATSL